MCEPDGPRGGRVGETLAQSSEELIAVRYAKGDCVAKRIEQLTSSGEISSCGI